MKGAVRGSFVPPAPVQEMRDLTRTRKQLVREVAQHTQRIQKVLGGASVGDDRGFYASAASPPPPHLTEPWFCCAAPTRCQLGAV